MYVGENVIVDGSIVPQKLPKLEDLPSSKSSTGISVGMAAVLHVGRDCRQGRGQGCHDGGYYCGGCQVKECKAGAESTLEQKAMNR